MKLRGMGVLIFFLLMGAALFSGGCGHTPACQTSLVKLDETRLDAETYEQEAAETAKNISDLEKRLSEKKSDIEQVKEKPGELKKQVYIIKKGSGRE